MNNKHLPARKLFEQISLAILFSVIGSVIIIVFSQYRPLLSEGYDLLGRFCLILVLLVLSFLARRSNSFHKYWQLLLGLFIMTCAVSLD